MKYIITPTRRTNDEQKMQTHVEKRHFADEASAPGGGGSVERTRTATGSTAGVIVEGGLSTGLLVTRSHRQFLQKFC